MVKQFGVQFHISTCFHGISATNNKPETLCNCTNTMVLNLTLFSWFLTQISTGFLLLNYHFGVKFKMEIYITLNETIQSRLISVYTHCNQVYILDLSLIWQIYPLSLCFCIREFVYRNWCWRHESESQWRHLEGKALYSIENKLIKWPIKYLTPFLLVECIWVIISDQAHFGVNWLDELRLILLR